MSSQSRESGSCWKEVRNNVDILGPGLITESLEKQVGEIGGWH